MANNRLSIQKNKTMEKFEFYEEILEDVNPTIKEFVLYLLFKINDDLDKQISDKFTVYLIPTIMRIVLNYFKMEGIDIKTKSEYISIPNDGNHILNSINVNDVSRKLFEFYNNILVKEEMYLPNIDYEVELLDLFANDYIIGLKKWN